MKKQGKKKKAAGRGRPPVFGDRRNLLIALREAEINWLDERAAASNVSRTELVMALLEMTRTLEVFRYLKIDDHGIVCFRPIGDVDDAVPRFVDGSVDEGGLDDCWPIAIDAKNPADSGLHRQAGAVEPSETDDEGSSDDLP